MTEPRLRLHGLDVLRGLVMALMVIDHVRDFVAPTTFDVEDPAVTTPAWFFVRWVTHFCAPVFVFLAGTGAWLKSRRISRGELSRWLLVRGVWLIFLEIAVINPLFMGGMWVAMGFYLFAIQVIWAIGVGFLVLAGLVWLPSRVVLALSLLLIVGHNALDGWRPAAGGAGFGWDVLHTGMAFHSLDAIFGVTGAGAARSLLIVYPLIPWVGVLSLGWCLGPWLATADPGRSRRVLVTGLFMIGAFLLLRGVDRYGDPQRWSVQDRGFAYTALSFLRCTKYPPSLLYLLMTLGPALAILPWLGRLGGAVGRFLAVIGRVPLFYYVAHLVLINGVALALAVAERRTIGWWWRIPMTGEGLDGYEPRVLRVLVISALVVALLYLPCRAWGRLKAEGRHGWASYL